MRIEYTVTYKPHLRHIILHFKKEDGTFFVTAPKGARASDIEAFVQSREEWCRKVYVQPPDTSSILLFGQPYEIEVSNGKRDMAVLENGKASVTVKGDGQDQSKVKRILCRELSTQLVPVLIRRVQHFSSLLGSELQVDKGHANQESLGSMLLCRSAQLFSALQCIGAQADRLHSAA